MSGTKKSKGIVSWIVIIAIWAFVGAVAYLSFFPAK